VRERENIAEREYRDENTAVRNGRTRFGCGKKIIYDGEKKINKK